MMALLFVTLPFVVRAVQPTLIELDQDMEEAAASLGATRWTIFRRIVLPNLRPAILAGAALAFARAIGEFGSLILLSGNIPGKTEVASVFIFGQIESGNTTGAAAVSVVLLTVSLAVLLALGARRSPRGGRSRWPVERCRSARRPRSASRRRSTVVRSGPSTASASASSSTSRRCC